MLIITRKNSQYIGVLMLISFIINIITLVSAKSLPHNKSHNSRKLNGKLQALASTTNEQLFHQKTGDLRQLLIKPAISRSFNMQQTAVATRPYLNNIEYDLRLRQLMEELVSNSRIENPHYAVHTLLPMELKDSYQQHLEAMEATATATATATEAPVSTADNPNFTHNNKITTSNDRENYQQQQHQHQEDNKDFVNTSSLLTPVNVLLLLNKRNTTSTTKSQTLSSSSSSSSSSLTSSGGPSLSIASLKDSLLDYVLLEYMTKTKQNLTKILDTNLVEGNSLAALPNAQRIRQQLEFLQKNAEKFKKFQQVEERTKNASAVTEFDVLKNINDIQESAMKEQHLFEVWKEILNDENEYLIKSKISVNKANSSSNFLTQPNVTNVGILQDFSIQRKQNDTDVEISENFENLRNSSASKNEIDTNTNSRTQVLENIPIFKKDLQLMQSYNNSLLGNDLSPTKSNESQVFLETISKIMNTNSSTFTPISDTNLMPKNELYLPGSDKKIGNVFQPHFETTTISELSEVMENEETVKLDIHKTEDVTTESKIQATTETGTDSKIPGYFAEVQRQVLSTTANYETETGLEGITNETTENIFHGNLTTPKLFDRKKDNNNIHLPDQRFELEDITTTKTGMEKKNPGSNAKERHEASSAKLAAEQLILSSNPPLSLMLMKHLEPPVLSRYEETTLAKNELLPASQVIPIQKSEVNNLGNELEAIIAETTTEQQLLNLKPSEIATKAPSYEHEATTESTYNRQLVTTSEIPDLPKVTTSENSVDNHILTTIHEINIESIQVPNTSNFDTKSETDKVPIGETDNPVTILESSTLTILGGREPEFNIINTKIFDHQINVDGSYDRQSSSSGSKLSNELSSSLNNSLSTGKEASKYLTSSEIVNPMNTTTLISNINNTGNELTTEFPSAIKNALDSTTNVLESTTNFPDSTTSFLQSIEDKIITKSAFAITADFWSSEVPPFRDDSTEVNLPDTTTEVWLSNLGQETTSEIDDEEITEFPMTDTSTIPDLKTFQNVKNPILREPPATGMIPTKTGQYETSSIPLLNEVSELTTELPTTETSFGYEEIAGSTKHYDAKLDPPSNKIDKLANGLPISGVMQDFPQIPTEKLTTNIPIITKLPIIDTYFTRDATTDTFKTITKVLPLSTQTQTEQINNYIEITTEFPLTDSYFPKEESTNTPKTTKEEMPTPTQIPTEESITKSRTPIELPITGITYTRLKSTDTPKTTKNVIANSIQIISEEINTDSAIATKLPTNDTNFEGEDTTDAFLTHSIEQSKYKSKIVAELPIDETYFTREKATGSPESKTKVMPASTQIQTEETTLELPTNNIKFAGENTIATSITMTEVKPLSAEIPTKESLYKSKVSTELPITDFDTGLPTNNNNFIREDTTHKSITTTEVKPSFAPILTKETLSKQEITTELPIADFDSTVEGPTYNPNKDMPPAIKIPTEVLTADSTLTTELPSTDTKLEGQNKTHTHISTTKVMPHTTTTQIPQQDTNIESDITDELSTIETYLKSLESSDIPKPTVASNVIATVTVFSLSSNKKELTTELPTRKTDFVTTKIPSQTTIRREETTNASSLTNDILSPEQTTSKAVLPIIKTHFLTEEITLSSDKPVVMETNHTDILSGLSDFKDEIPTELPITQIQLPDFASSLQTAELFPVNGTKVKSDSQPALSIAQSHVSHKIDVTNHIVNNPEEYSTDKRKANKEHTSILYIKEKLNGALNVTTATPGAERETNYTSQENNQSLKNLNYDAGLQFTLNKKSSQSGNTGVDGIILAKVQPEKLKIEQSTVSTNTIKTETSQSDNLIPDRLLVPGLPTENFKSKQPVISTNDIKSETSKSDSLIPNRHLVRKLPTGNLKSEQSTISTNVIQSEASQTDNVIPDRLLAPELPTENVTTEQSALVASAAKSETSQSGNLISDRLLIPELTTLKLKSEQSTNSTNAIKSEIYQSDNVIPNVQLLPELPTKKLRSELSAVSTNTVFEVPDDYANFENVHTFQPKIGFLKENVEETSNLSNLEPKPNYGSLGVAAVVKHDLNLPDVEVFLQGVTSQEVNSIKYNVEDSHLKKDTVENLSVKQSSMKNENIELTKGISLRDQGQVALKFQESESVSSSSLIPESFQVILTKDNVIQSKSNETEFEVDKRMAAKPEDDIEQSQQDKLNIDDSYHNKPINDIVWFLYSSSRTPSIIHKKLSLPYETSVTQPFSTFAEQLPNATKLEIVKPQEAPESRLDELITIIGNSLQETSGSNTKSQHVATEVTRQCLGNNNKQQQPEEKEQEQQHQGLKIHDDGTAVLLNCGSATEQTMQLTTLPSTALPAAAVAESLALRTIAPNEQENVQMMAISKTIENQKDNKGKLTTFKNNHLSNDSLTKADDNEDVQIPEIKKENANDHSPDGDEDEHKDDSEDDEGVHDVGAANKSSINDKDIRLEKKVRPYNVMATEINSSNNTPVEVERHHDGNVLDRTNNAQYTNNAFKISTATKTMATVEDKSVVETEGGLNEMSTIETKLFDISKDNRNDMTITGLKKEGHSANPTLYEVVNDDVTTIGLKKDYTQKGNEHEMTLLESQGEKGDHEYIITFPTSFSSDETEQDEVISANIEALDAVAQEVEQLPTLTDTFLNTQSFPDVTPYHSNLYYKSYRSRKKQQKLKHIHASVNPHPKEEITTTNWWHSLPYAEIRKFLNSISDSVEGW